MTITPNSLTRYGSFSAISYVNGVSLSGHAASNSACRAFFTEGVFRTWKKPIVMALLVVSVPATRKL